MKAQGDPLPPPIFFPSLMSANVKCPVGAESTRYRPELQNQAGPQRQSQDILQNALGPRHCMRKSLGTAATGLPH